MAKKKRRSRKRGSSLNGVPSSNKKMGILPCLAWGTGASLLGMVTGGAGASLGLWSAPIGIALATYGFKRNDNIGKLAIAAGVGIMAGTTIEAAKGMQGTNDEEMEGFDLKAMAERAKSYYRSLGKKYKLPIGKTDEAASTDGLNGDEEVNYFVNPYTNSKQIDMSALDRIQANVSQMAGPVNGSVGEVDPAERNY